MKWSVTQSGLQGDMSPLEQLRPNVGGMKGSRGPSPCLPGLPHLSFLWGVAESLRLIPQQIEVPVQN